MEDLQVDFHFEAKGKALTIQILNHSDTDLFIKFILEKDGESCQRFGVVFCSWLLYIQIIMYTVYCR